VAAFVLSILALIGFYCFAKFVPDLQHRALWLECLTIGPYLLAVLTFSRLRPTFRTGILLVLGIGLALQLIAMADPPTSSDDDYRYLWDAKVQLAGIDPYRYAPDASQLAHLRTPFFFPDRVNCAWPIDHGSACTAINRPGVRTVYPPVAQAAFDLIRIVSLGGRGGHLPVQLVAALGAIAIGWLLARRALARGRGLWPAALWSWCPMVSVEFGNNAHIDWLGVLLCVLALTSEAARRSGWAGALVGAAIATKLYPGLVLASLLRRRPVLVLSCASAVVVLSYVPHMIAVGPDVIGYLPGYLHDEQYTSGGRFLLLSPWLPPSLALVAAALALAGVALWVIRHTDAAVPEDSAVVMAAAVTLVSTPAYGWYSLLLLALVAMSGAVQWLPVALVGSYFYLVQGDFGLSPTLGTSLYGGALALTVLIWASRARPASPRRQRAGAAAGAGTGRPRCGGRPRSVR